MKRQKKWMEGSRKDLTDEQLYELMQMMHPDGKEPCDSDEKAAFEASLGL
jgi:hypothetical protein